MAPHNETRTLGWLHLTDLHIGQPREGGRLANIEREFLRDLEKVVAETERPIRIVFFSGDIAFRGAESEYVRATAMLGRICNRIRSLNQRFDSSPHSIPVLVPVPGNHDLARPSRAEAEAIRAAFASRGADAPPLWEPGQRGVEELISRCFSGYSSWLRHHPLPLPKGWVPGLIPGDLRATITRDNLRIGVLALNASYLHLGDEAPGSLHLDLSQVTHLLGSNTRAWVESHDFCVLVTHHPPTWLSEVARTTLDHEIKPNALFDMHLFGHEHVGSHRQDPGSAGIRHLIEGRSLFGAEEDGTPRTHGYVVGAFAVQGDGTHSTKSARIFTRQGWRDGHGWHFGPGDTKWGRWHLDIHLGSTPQLAPSAPTSAMGTVAPELDPTLGDLSASGKLAWKTVRDEHEFDALLLEASPDQRWILLSASVPYWMSDPERRRREQKYLESARPEAILAFVRELAAAIGARHPKLGILFGGHPSITQAIASTVLATKRDRPWLTLVQDEHFWHQLVEDVGVLACAKGVLPVLLPSAGSGPNLQRLRSTMTSPSSLCAAVFLGGMSGVLDEFQKVGERRPELPRYCVGLGGGAAAELLLDPNTAPQATGAVAVPTVATTERTIANPATLWHTPQLAVQTILAAIDRPS